MNARNLKGTKISIATGEQRQDYKIHKRHLHLAKQDKNKDCFIKILNYKSMYKIYIEDLEEANDIEDVPVLKITGHPVLQLLPTTFLCKEDVLLLPAVRD